jgi:hypothetical protein
MTTGFLSRAIKCKRVRFSIILPVFLLPLFVFCQKESEGLIKQKLTVILKDDLKAICEGISKENLLEKPNYNLVFYKSYDKGLYTRKAVVDFYFLKKVNVKIVRKYRYYGSKRMWDRYYNEYSFLSDSISSVPEK